MEKVNKLMFVVSEGLFSNDFVPTEQSKMSVSGCYSLRSKTQPCEPLYNNILNLRGFAK